jgi:hypothetical protein
MYPRPLFKYKGENSDVNPATSGNLSRGFKTNNDRPCNPARTESFQPPPKTAFQRQCKHIQSGAIYGTPESFSSLGEWNAQKPLIPKRRGDFMGMPGAVSGIYHSEGSETPLKLEPEHKDKSESVTSVATEKAKPFDNLFERNWTKNQQERLQRGLMENPHDPKLREMAETVLRIGRRIDGIQENENAPAQEERPQEEPAQEEPAQEEPQAEEKQEVPRTPSSQIRLPPISGLKRLGTPHSPKPDEGKFAVDSELDTSDDGDGDAGEGKVAESAPKPVTHVNRRLKSAIAKLSKPSFSQQEKDTRDEKLQEIITKFKINPPRPTLVASVIKALKDQLTT